MSTISVVLPSWVKTFNNLTYKITVTDAHNKSTDFILNATNRQILFHI